MQDVGLPSTPSDALPGDSCPSWIHDPKRSLLFLFFISYLHMIFSLSLFFLAIINNFLYLYFVFTLPPSSSPNSFTRLALFLSFLASLALYPLGLGATASQAQSSRRATERIYDPTPRSTEY
ncbi:hypothetical protein M752DRAFT_40819 [Aspergillus phoenicis ATCC 13157]|uniref:Uncharacterized protein n=1 Tax=Aspergillus phoenicis ATCC 13157 TaxID=1353007 RepID=A0A370PDJ0_ASPPH|nr:hypothetical protein M752DRAFT_40819 [Aspergillus phoenicis ATCC 13157]